MSDPNPRSENQRFTSTVDLPTETGEMALPVAVRLLDQVLWATAAGNALAEPVDPALVSALEAVARRYAGAAMQLEPVGVAVLESLLLAEFPLFASRGELLSRAARAVGASLLADPVARRRLEHLWAILGERLA